MFYETIDTHEIIDLFHHFIQPVSEIRVMRLVGDTKLGKSHLVTKVFPFIARQDYQASCSVFDLRNQLHAVPDILHMVCGQLGSNACECYYAAHQTWANRSKVRIEHILVLFSLFNVSSKDNLNDMHYRDRQLTTQFVHDLSSSTERPLLLLFDSVDNATESIQIWLMDTLLTLLSPLTHVRVVVAGRSLPEAHGSYKSICSTYSCDQ